MGSIPLPALDYRPPQQPDQFQQLGRLMALKQAVQNAPLEHQILQQQQQSGANALQMQQMQMNSNKALMGAFAGLNPSDPDYFQKGIEKAQASGQVLPQTLQGVMNARMDFQTKYATLTKTQQEIAQTRSDNLHALGTQYLQESDQDMAQNWPTMRQKIVALHANDQNFDPNSLPMQFPGRQAVEASTVLQGMSAAGMRAAAAAQSAKYKVVDGTLYDMSGETPKPALAGTLDPARWNSIVDSIVPKGSGNDALNARTHSAVDFYLKNGNATGAQQALTTAAQQVGSIEKETNPAALKAKEDVAAVEGQSRAAAYAGLRQYPVFDNKTGKTVYESPAEINAARATEPGRYTVPSYTAGAIGQRDATNYFIKGKGGQQLTAFNTALNHLDTLDSLASALGNSNIQVFNKAAQAWAEQTGNPAPTNFAAAKNAMSGEVAAALKASGATDDEIRKVDQTFNRAQSPMQLKGAIATYRTLLKSKAHNLQEQYQQGMQGLPNFNPAPTRPAPPSGGTSVSLKAAMALPINKGKSADAVKADIIAHGHAVTE